MIMQKHITRMTLREKCAQTVFGDFDFADPDYDLVMRLVKKEGVGGLVLHGGSIFDVTPFVNSLQRVSKFPLLLAAHYANGAGGEVSGATAYPSNLAVAATGSEDLALLKGRHTGLEARVLGIHLILRPDPASYGADAALAERLARAAVRGLQAGGALAEGVDVAVGAGADVLLCRADAEAAITGLEESLKAGRLDEKALDLRVEKILAAKEKLGLFGERILDMAGVERVVGNDAHRAGAQKVADAAVTLVRGAGRVEGSVAVIAGAAKVFEAELARKVKPDDAAGTCVVAVFDDPAPAVEAAKKHKDVIAVSFGRPAPIGGVGGHVCAYGADEASQRAAARALLGEIPFRGNLPVPLGI